MKNRLGWNRGKKKENKELYFFHITIFGGVWRARRGRARNNLEAKLKQAKKKPPL